MDRIFIGIIKMLVVVIVIFGLFMEQPRGQKGTAWVINIVLIKQLETNK